MTKTLGWTLRPRVREVDPVKAWRVGSLLWVSALGGMSFDLFVGAGHGIGPASETLAVALGFVTVPLILVRMRTPTTEAKDKVILLLVYLCGTALSVMVFVPWYVTHGVTCSATGKVVHNAAIATYFSVATLTTLGFGDYVPHDGVVRALAAGEAVLGYLLLGVIVAGLVTYVRDRQVGTAG